MASDVEVLRKLLEAFAKGYFSGNAWVAEVPIRDGAYPASDPARDTKAALSAAISALGRVEELEKALETERRERRFLEESVRRHVCPAVSIP